jgi:hypothetical protein
MVKGLVRLFVPIVLLTLACNFPTATTNTPEMPTLEPSATSPSPTETQAEPTDELAQASPTLSPTSSFECPNVLPTRLEVGGTGRVTYTDSVLTRLRRDPLVANNNIIQLLTDGTLFEIIDGPVCTTVPTTGEAYIFWQVRLISEPIEGWIAEADASNYYVEPIP